MMDNKYDDLLIQGLTRLKDLEFAYVSDEPELDYEFSEEYIKSKEKLIKNLSRSYWKYVNTVAKKVAVIIIALIIMFSSLMTVDAFREKIVEFAYNIYDRFSIIIRDDLIKKDCLTKLYKPNFTDKIYHIESSTYSLGFVSTFFKTNHKHSIAFTQSNISDANKLNSEYGELQEQLINHTPCLVCKTNTDYICYWEFDGYRFELIYPIDLGEEFMSEVVGNLVEIDPDELHS